MSTAGELRVPRALAHAFHSTIPNDFICFHFLYPAKGEGGFNSLLLIRDDFSNYMWLRSAPSCTGQMVYEVLLDWFAAFGVARNWSSDQGSHFVHSLMQGLS